MDRVLCLENSSVRLYDPRGRLSKDIKVEFVPRTIVMLDDERGVVIGCDGEKYPFNIYNTFCIKSKNSELGPKDNYYCSNMDDNNTEVFTQNTLANRASKILTMKLNGILPEPAIVDSSTIGRRIIFVTENRDTIIEKK